MERFYADVGALDGSLQEAPEVFKFVRVHVPIDVGFSVVDYLMGVFCIQSFVGFQFVREQFSPASYVLVNLFLDAVLPSVRED